MYFILADSTSYAWLFILMLILPGIIYYLIKIIKVAKYNKSNILHQAEVNRVVLDELHDSGFVLHKQIIFENIKTISGNRNDKKLILFDNENKKIVLIDYKTGKKGVGNYKDIIGCEVYENSDSQISGTSLGNYGIGIFNGISVGRVRTLRIVIRLKDYECPYVTYDLIDENMTIFTIPKNDIRYIRILDSIQELKSYIEVIKKIEETNK